MAPGREVFVRVAGVVCRLRVAGGFVGWGVFRPTDPAAAELVRPATLGERRRYLDLLPAHRLLLCERLGRDWLAHPAHGPAGAPLAPVRLVEDGQRFELVVARSDGVQCWFDQPDERANPAAAAYLREAFRNRVPTAALRRRGLTGGHKATYAIAEQLRHEAERDRTEDRLGGALAHAGAELAGYVERDDGFRVEYEVDGQRHVSLIDKRNLGVRLAGICLNGEDARFDLQSLVGVLREAPGALPIGADNGGMTEEQYWRVHPPPE
jgi:hypothetical protein